MKTRCPFCKHVFKAPDIYNGRMVKCPHCSESFLISQYTTPPLVKPESIEQAKQTASRIAKDNLITAAWKGVPQPFKTGFFTTLGVAAALVLSLLVYSKYLFRQTASNSDRSVTASRVIENRLSVDRFTVEFLDRMEDQTTVVLTMWLTNPHPYTVEYSAKVEFFTSTRDRVTASGVILGTEFGGSSGREVTHLIWLDNAHADRIDLSKSRLAFTKAPITY